MTDTEKNVPCGAPEGGAVPWRSGPRTVTPRYRLGRLGGASGEGLTLPATISGQWDDPLMSFDRKLFKKLTEGLTEGLDQLRAIFTQDDGQ